MFEPATPRSASNAAIAAVKRVSGKLTATIRPTLEALVLKSGGNRQPVAFQKLQKPGKSQQFFAGSNKTQDQVDNEDSVDPSLNNTQGIVGCLLAEPALDMRRRQERKNLGPAKRALFCQNMNLAPASLLP